MTLKQQMRRFRAGLAPIPLSYVMLHHDAAVTDLPRFLAARELFLNEVTLERDGWGDGMLVLQAETIDDRTGKTRIFRWSDANGGSWFERHAHAGQSLVEISPAAPGRSANNGCPRPPSIYSSPS